MDPQGPLKNSPLLRASSLARALGPSGVQMAGGTKEKPSRTAPPGKARQQGSTRNRAAPASSFPGSRAKPKPEVAGICPPEPGSSPVARRSRLWGRLKRLQPWAAGTRSPAARTGPAAASSWAAHPAIPASCSRSSRPHPCPCVHLAAFPATGCLTRPQLPGSDALREGAALRTPFLQASCSSSARKRTDHLSPDDDCGGVSASPQSRSKMKAEERIHSSPTRQMLRKTKVAEITISCKSRLAGAESSRSGAKSGRGKPRDQPLSLRHVGSPLTHSGM